MAPAFQTFLRPEHQVVGLLTGTSWHFSDISSDISAPCMHERNSFDVNRTNGMLTSNARRIFCDSVLALEQINAARIGVICQGASIAPHFLLARAQLSICFPISCSFIHLTTPYSFPLSLSCRLLSRNYVRTSEDFSL